MKITHYFLNWNDSFYLPFIKKHYGAFCQRIVMYDNHSDDGSQQLAKDLGFEVRTFGYTNRLDDQDYLNVKNHCWKEERENGQRADYVIVADADEFVSLPKANRLTAIAPAVVGYNMISERLPVDDIFEINTGAPSENYSKQAIFNPVVTEEINFVHGCHKNYMTPPQIQTGQICELHHFRQIGGLVRMLDRHAKYRPRMSKFNVKNKMGFHYGDPSWNELRIKEFNEEKRMEWEQLTSEAKQLW